jgi:hypothetical protein
MPAFFANGGLESHLLNSIPQLKDRDKVLREAMINGLALVLFRIQQKGLNSQEQSLGNYNSWYAKKRENQGLQTKKIDLTYTGQMTQNFKVIPYKDNGYALGFDNAFAGQKAEWNEERFGDIFTPSQNEQMQIMVMVTNRINQILFNF